MLREYRLRCIRARRRLPAPPAPPRLRPRHRRAGAVLPRRAAPRCATPTPSIPRRLRLNIPEELRGKPRVRVCRAGGQRAVLRLAARCRARRRRHERAFPTITATLAADLDAAPARRERGHARHNREGCGQDRRRRRRRHRRGVRDAGRRPGDRSRQVAQRPREPATRRAEAAQEPLLQRVEYIAYRVVARAVAAMSRGASAPLGHAPRRAGVEGPARARPAGHAQPARDVSRARRARRCAGRSTNAGAISAASC